jgi:ABC-type uncharacterized transport system permease subunit
MEPSRLLLVLATLAFLGGVVHAVITLRAGRWHESRWHLLPMAVGFGFQSAFLYLRGQSHGRCPLTNQFEIFIFIGWSIVLLYFLVGTAFRLSLLGVFTAPLLTILQTIAMLSPLDTDIEPKGAVNAWKELHATVALVGYAAFALACITGIMFLLQDRMLKKHRINALFHQLPPIHDLANAIKRMVIVGLVLLTIGHLSSFMIMSPVPGFLHLMSWGVWTLYLVIAILMQRRTLTARQIAWLAVLGFAFPFISLWLIAR